MVTTGPDGVDLSCLQGNIFRAYGRHYRAVRHLVLRVVEPRTARAALASMLDRDRSTPDVTRADVSPRSTGYDWCLNVGFTWSGLAAVGVPAASLTTFPPEFRDGMAARADILGDVGPSSPEHWIAGLNRTADVHLIVSIHGRTAADVDPVAERVVGLQGGRAFAPVSGDVLAGAALGAPGDDFGRVHFGYRDGISQPRFDGDADPGAPGQRFTPVGTVLLGHEAPLPAVEWTVPQPDQLGRDGTFNAFRVLGQDVAGFHRYLASAATQLGCSAEEVAAKLCGRWSNGAPLVKAPPAAAAARYDADDVKGDLTELNGFGYREADSDGARCPIGSHIRRTNPRDARIVQRGSNDVRGLVRRGMPFGPDYDPAAPDQPDVARGLLGNFICANLASQFEAMQADWVNLGLQDPRITGTNDPLVGANEAATGRFDLTTAAGTRATLRSLPSFVRTLGGAYCFLPSIPALEWLAAGAWSR